MSKYQFIYSYLDGSPAITRKENNSFVGYLTLKEIEDIESLIKNYFTYKYNSYAYKDLIISEFFNYEKAYLKAYDKIKKLMPFK